MIKSLSNYSNKEEEDKNGKKKNHER